MTLTIDIPDEFVASIEAYMATQRKHESDPETGTMVLKPVYASIEDFVSSILYQPIKSIAFQFPIHPAVRSQIIAQKAAESELEKAIKPKVTKNV